jgi:signal transduction histidine kinase
VPATVGTKLLVIFVGTVLLLVVLGVLGLRVLGQSNDRVEQLGDLQLRATGYRELQTDVAEGRVLLGLRAGGKDVKLYVGDPSSTPRGRNLLFLDQTILSIVAQVGPATGSNHLGFVPPQDDQATLRKIRSDAEQLSQTMNQILDLDRSGSAKEGLQLQSSEAEPLATDLRILATRLVNATQAETDALIAENRSSFANSERLFIAVATGSVVLALLLGLVLAWSVIGPIQRVEARVAEIAGGDFSGRVDVSNRDELGRLGANVNRMNDRLGQLYQEVETVSRHKSEFLANMSHELRTPLNAIIGFSDVLHEQMFGELNEQQLGYVSDVQEAGRHLLSLINDILDLAKVEAGRMDLELVDVSIPETLRSGLTMHGERAARDGITLELTCDPAEIVVQADERKLRQVVFNLLSNAVKFTPAGGHVGVSACVTDGFVEVAVADTGSGIDAADQDRVFEEFQQVAGPSDAREGTGLGLPLSRKMIELHGGRLWVESEPGVGSIFRFTLPVAARAS